jgi:hypothetical protein
MKPPLARYLVAAFLFASATFLFADDFKSVTITGGIPLGPIRVHGDQFMVIRNFTQDTTQAPRGFVMVTQLPGNTPVNVLSAARLDAPTLEVINSVVIAGPADVTVACDQSAICFISFKKDSN